MTSKRKNKVMEEKIIMLENKIEGLEKIIIEHLQRNLKVTNAITSFMSTIVDFRNDHQIEHEGISKSIDLISKAITLINSSC